jgi:carboxyl-terminal processing protease
MATSKKTSARKVSRKKTPRVVRGAQSSRSGSSAKSAPSIGPSTSIGEMSPARRIIKSSPAVEIDQFNTASQAETIVLAQEVARKVNSQGKTPISYRLTSLLIIGVLIFAAGVQIGGRRNSSIVDSAIDTLISNRPGEINRGVLERAAIEAALKASGDAWANYFPQSALKVLDEANTNSYSGIGASLRKSRGGVIEISGVTSKSPASEAGLMVGDEVLAINETDVQGASLTSAIALIRGAIAEKVDLLVMRDDKKVLLSIAPRKISASSVEATQVGSTVGLVAISNFSAGTASEVQKSLERLKIRDGLIIDLRNNPGGLIDEAVKIAQLFVGNGTIVSYRLSGNEKVYAARNPIPITVPIVVMINRSTASAAEILASALQDRNRGVVIGEKSYGKGSVQEFVTLEDGSKLELTVALYITPSGRTIEGVGVTPDLEVKPSDLGTKALQILGGLASLSTPKAGTSK